MRAQAVISFVISAVIFMFVLVYVVQSTIDWMNPLFLQYQENERKAVADSILSLLVTQPGAWSGGADWENNPSKVTRLGVSSDYMQLSTSKVSALSELEPEKVKSLFGPKYNYKICIGTGCTLADVRTGPSSTPGEKFAEGTYLGQGDRKINVKVTVQ